MKKFLIIAALLSVFTAGVFAQSTNINVVPEKDESKWSNFTYQNIPVLKVLEARDAYVVIYQKYHAGTGSVVIPKSWASGNPENPRKLKFRDIKNPQNAFMTVVKKGGEFHRVILTIPMSKSNNLWGVIEYSKDVEGSDKTTLEDIEL